MKISTFMYEQLFSFAPIGFALNKMDGTFIDFNKEILSFTGYTKDEFFKLTYWDLTPIEYAKQEEEQLNSLNDTGGYGPYVKEYFHKAGHRIDVLLNGIIVSDENDEKYIFSTVQDISKTKKSERVLNKAQELGHIGHWHLDIVNNDLSWSDETYRIFGLEPQSFGATYEAFIDRIYPDDVELVNTAYTTSVEKDKSYEIEHRVVRPDGEIRYVIERCEHYHSKNGEIIGSIGAVIDVTKQKENEDALIEAKNKAEVANIMKSSFIANMNHELRTPLNAILGFTKNMLHDENLDDKYKKQFSIINNSGEHLLGIINDILDMSKIEAGEMKVDNSEFNFLKTLKTINEIMSIQVKSKNLKCKYSYDENISKPIISDEGKIRQILFNIIGNAIKFTEKGSISVDVLIKSIKGREFLNIKISDTGCGIHENMIKEVFKPFVQNDGVKKIEGGTGLGLAISKKLVELLDGSISLKSEVGKGSSFTIVVPIVLVDKADVDNYRNAKAIKNIKNNIEAIDEKNIDINIDKLSKKTTKKILDAAIKGSKDKINKEIDKIKNNNEDLYIYLSNLVDKYDFKAIIEFLKESDE